MLQMSRLKKPDKGTFFEMLPVAMILIVLLAGFLLLMGKSIISTVEIHTVLRLKSEFYENLKETTAIYSFLMSSNKTEKGEINVIECLKFLDCYDDMGSSCNKYFGEAYDKTSCEILIESSGNRVWGEENATVIFGSYKKVFNYEKQNYKHGFSYGLFVPFRKKIEWLKVEVE